MHCEGSSVAMSSFDTDSFQRIWHIVSNLNDSTELASYFKTSLVGIDIKALINRLNPLHRDCNSLLHECKSGFVIQVLLNEGIDINLRNKVGQTALQLACQKGYIDFVRLYIKQGADVNMACNKGNTPLHEACIGGFVKIVKLLIEAKADTNLVNEDDNTPLHILSEKGGVKSMAILLQLNDPELNLINNKGKQEQEEEEVEEEEDEVDEEEVLQDPKVIDEQRVTKIEIANIHGYTPLLCALRYGATPAVIMLLEAGASRAVKSKQGWDIDRFIYYFDLKNTKIAIKEHEELLQDIKMKKQAQKELRASRRLWRLCVLDVHRDGKGFNEVAAKKFLTKYHLKFSILNWVHPRDANGRSVVHYINSEVMYTMLANAGADMNKKDAKGSSILHYLCHIGSRNPDVMKIMPKLIRKRIDVNHLNDYQSSPLHFACICNDIPMSTFLLEHNAQVSLRITDLEANNPTMYACHHNNVELLQVLLKHGATLDQKYADKGITPLHIATSKNHVELSQYIISQKADLNIPDGAGWTALHEVAYRGLEQMVTLLLEGGCNMWLRTHETALARDLAHIKGHEGVVKILDKWAQSKEQQALEKAMTREYNNPYVLLDNDKVEAKLWDLLVRDHDVDEVRLLTSYWKFDRDIVNCRRRNYDPKMKRKPLHFAKTPEMIRALIDGGCYTFQYDKTGASALHYYCRQGKLDLVKTIVEAQADVNDVDKSRATPLFDAVCFNQTEIVEYLIEHGADPNIMQYSGDGPLHSAAANGNAKIVDLLIAGTSVKGKRLKADVNIKTYNKFTPVYYAVDNANLEVLQKLLDAGGKVNTRTDYGVAPLHCAAKHGLLNEFKLLLEYGAKLNILNNNKQTSLHIAAMHGQTNIVEHILTLQGLDEEDGHGKKAVDYAKKKKFVDIVDLLDNGLPNESVRA